MYYVQKRMEIAGAHSLELPYESKCSNIHGHNWIITVYICAPKLNSNGMVYDFVKIKKKIHDRLDHQCLNELIDQPTAENIAAWVLEELNKDVDCYRVDVQESEGNMASYVADWWEDR